VWIPPGVCAAYLKAAGPAVVGGPVSASYCRGSGRLPAVLLSRDGVAPRVDGPPRSAARTAAGPSAADHAIFRGVSRVSRRGQRQVGDLRGDFWRIFACRGPRTRVNTEISHAGSQRRRPRPTHWAEPSPARPGDRDPKHREPATPLVSAELIAGHRAQPRVCVTVRANKLRPKQTPTTGVPAPIAQPLFSQSAGAVSDTI
jgi:hypothetical protein